MGTFSCMQISQFQYKWFLGFLRGCKTINTRRQNHCNMLHDSTQVPHRKQVLICQFSPPPLPPLRKPETRVNLSISPPHPPPPPPAKHGLSYEPFNLAPPPLLPPPKLILSIIRWFLALDCLIAKSKTKLKLCYASFRDMRPLSLALFKQPNGALLCLTAAAGNLDGLQSLARAPGWLTDKVSSSDALTPRNSWMELSATNGMRDRLHGRSCMTALG